LKESNDAPACDREGQAAEDRECLPLSLAESLEGVLGSSEEQGPSIGEIVDGVGDKGFGLLFVFLSLPSALPVPAPGYSTPFGIVIVLIALQMLVGRRVLWLPQRLRSVRLRKSVSRRVIKTGSGAIRRLESVIRPRHDWIGSPLGLKALALVIMCMGALMILPIPLTNTAQAMVIFLIGLGLAEDDGLLALGAFGVGCCAVALYAYVVYLFFTYGPDAVYEIKDWIKGLLGAD
jgi:hypothetical protein